LKKPITIGVIAVIVIFFIGFDYAFAESVESMPPTDVITVKIPKDTKVAYCQNQKICYIPTKARIEVGQTIEWINLDSIEHTVTSGSHEEGPSGKFDSGLLASGTKFSHTFEKSGEFGYYCTLHPGNEGIVIVSEPTLEKPEPAPDPARDLEQIKNFPFDETKGTDYYLDRYYTEQEYKIWFDKNYPNLTIEEAIGLVEPYSLIKEQFSECATNAQQLYGDAMLSYRGSTGSIIGAEGQGGISIDNYFKSCRQDLIQLKDVAEILYEKEMYTESIIYLDRALDLHPGYKTALVDKGEALVGLGQFEEAVVYLDIALSIDPDFRDAKQLKDSLNTLNEDEEIEEKKESQEGGGCLIATATYGSELAPQVQQLRELRDNKLLNTESGSAFMESFNDFYYSFSPIIADYERENPYFKEAVKFAITPMIASLSILNYVEMETDAEVVGYGISLILLNVGMYVGVPAIVFVRFRK